MDQAQQGRLKERECEQAIREADPVDQAPLEKCLCIQIVQPAQAGPCTAAALVQVVLSVYADPLLAVLGPLAQSAF